MRGAKGETASMTELLKANKLGLWKILGLVFTAGNWVWVLSRLSLHAVNISASRN